MSDRPISDQIGTHLKTYSETVEKRVNTALTNAQTFGNQVTNLIAQLRAAGTTQGAGTAGTAPVAPTVAAPPTVNFTPPSLSPTSFGTITANMPKMVDLGDVPEIPELNIPDFQSTVGAINIPESPAWQAPAAAPSAPQVSQVVLPEAPQVNLPTLPQLADITVPTFAGMTLPTFDGKEPTFANPTPPSAMNFKEPEYRTEVIDEMIQKLRQMWAGGTGLPKAVEEAMWARAQEREDIVVHREVASLSSDFSARGFTMPSGLQLGREMQMRQELAGKKLGLQRELTIQIAQWQIENLRFACEQAVAAENVLVNIHSNMVQRMFEAAKFEVESQIALYNAQVGLFNARMNAYQIRAQVFNTLVQAELSKIQVFKAEVEAEVARGQINEQKVKVYTAQVNALQTQIEIFKAKMEGAATHAGVIRSQIEAYRAEVQAYGSQIEAQKVRFDAYEAQVRGEAAKAGIIDAEAKAYAALVSGKASIADVGVKRAEVLVKKNQNLISGYQAALEAEKTRIQAQLSVIQMNAAAYTAGTQQMAALAGAEAERAKVQIAAYEAQMRSNVAYYQAQVQYYLGSMEQGVRASANAVEALKAAGQIGSTMAAGAMAGVHTGISLTGASSMGANVSDTWSRSQAEVRQYNYDGGKA